MSKKELEYQKIGDFYLPKVSFPAEDEKIEREKYRKLYIDKFRESMKGHLDSIKIVNVDENGSQVENTKDKDTKYN